MPDPSGLDFVASPLARTRETMEILRRTAGLAPDGVRFDPRFAELGFGSWEGRTWKELRKQEALLYAERERDRWGFVPPGGESYAVLAERVGAAIADLTRDTLLVSHGGVARALMNLRSRAHVSDVLRASIWQGRILVFDGARHVWV